jgi:hypothetical protein
MSYSLFPVGTMYFSARVIFAEPHGRTRALPAGEFTKEP